MSYDMIFYNMILLYYIMILYKYLLGFFWATLTKCCLTRSRGQYNCPKGATIIIVAWNHSQYLFCHINKQTNKKDGIENFLSSTQNSQINFFTQSSLPKYHWHQMVTVDPLPPIRIKLQMFYLIYFIYNNSQILIFVMIANSCIARLLFTCFD